MTSLRPEETRARPEGHDLHDVFEIVDYSTATDWERVTAEFEKAFRAWALDTLDSKPIEAHNVRTTRPIEATLAGRRYRVSFQTRSRAAPRPVSSELLRQLDSSFHGEAPGVMRWAMATNFDFDQDAHVIQARLGIPEFVVLEPAESTYGDKISVSESKMLLSALVTAAANIGMDVPVFTQVFEARTRQFFGHCAGLGWTVTYDGVQLPVVPKSNAHIQGLLTLFHSKLTHLTSHIKAYVSVKFTYSVRNWLLDWARSSPGSVEGKEAEQRYSEPLVLPVGATGESLDCLYLACAWPHFREDVLLDDSLHSELTPTTAPSWWLSVQRRKKRPLCKLERILRNFMELCYTTSTFKELLGSGAYVDEEEETPDLGRNALRALTKQPPAISDDLVQAGRSLGARFGTVVGKTVRHMRKGRQTTGGDGGGLESKEIDDILGYMFIRVEDWDEREATSWRMTRCKSAPKRGLLHCLASYLACVDTYSGGLESVATLWSEFVMEIRWHWEHLKLLPRMAKADKPNMRSCLLQQKLELINCCIQRQLERNGGAPASQPTGDGAQEAAGEDNDDGDDEFFVCPEDEESVKKRLQDLKQRAVENPHEYSRREESAASEPQGVEQVHPKLKLLSGARLRNPRTQEPGPLTEDMMTRQLAEMEAMGDSEEAAQRRAHMQSSSLRSDMEAFKAANPGCELADFVRWHSPRDWLKNEDTGEYELSGRMRDPDNLWHRIWRESLPVPARRQRPLFDATAEVERALTDMESLTMQELARQLFPCLLEEVFTQLQGEVDGGSSPSSLVTKHASLKHLSSRLGENLQEDGDRYEEIIQRFADVEHEISVFSSLVHQLGPQQQELCVELLEHGRCLVLKEHHRDAVLRVFASFANERDLPRPERREFIFRAAAPQGVYRMYASLQDHSFDIAGGFTAPQLL